MPDVSTIKPDTGAAGGLDTAPQGPGPRPPGLGVRGWLRWGWRQLTSMRTALILLFLLALASVPGSVIPQRGLNPGAVDKFFAAHKTLAPILDKLSLFDVFAAPWFAAIYLLLFVSLAGCVVPRAWQHLKNVRARPPAAPRNLARLPHADSWESDLAADRVVAAAAALLRGRRFRVDTDGATVAAEKGYLRETGNLVFHLALLALLVAVGMGGLFGYKGDVLVVEGDGFANTVASYDSFKPGRIFSPSRLAPFSFQVDRFHADYITQGPQRGQPADFWARIRYRPAPGAPERPYLLRVNHPLAVDGTKVYLLGHGYAPVFRVTDGQGRVAFEGAVPFLPDDAATFTSEGVVKVPDARPQQLGFLGLFLPSTMLLPQQGLTSVFPAADNPTVTLIAFKGDLGLDSGAPQSVYQLDTSRMQKIDIPPKTLRPGQTLTLPNGAGSITFTGYKQYITLQTTYEPGRWYALGAALLAVLGLLPSLLVRRRRVWVRVRPGDQGRTVVETGGLTRMDGSGGFASEFQDLAAGLRAATTRPDGKE